MVAVQIAPEQVKSHPEWFGVRRALDLPRIERHEIAARDGTKLRLHHVPGTKGPVLLAPGTAMSGLSFCVDSVPRNLVEDLSARGYDIWLLDWRTSPELEAHKSPYTLDDAAKYDWPAAIDEVRARTGAEQVGVAAHCLSSTAMTMSLVRGYTPKEHVSAFVASQVAGHLVFNWVGRFKQWTFIDRLIGPDTMLHFRPEQITRSFGDRIISIMAPLIPKTYRGGTIPVKRHSATFGDLLHMPRVDQVTVDLMGSLIPQVLMAFLRDVMRFTRANDSSVFSDDDLQHLDRLALPVTFLVGEHNNMFVPEATRRTWALLCDRNGASHYERTVIQGYGHLDCIVGEKAAEDVFPLFAKGLERR